MQLESLSRKRDETRQQLPKFLTSREERTEIVGELTNTLSGVTGHRTMRRSALGNEGSMWHGVGQDKSRRHRARRNAGGCEVSGAVLAVLIITPSYPQAHRTTTGRACSALLQLRDSCTLGRLKNSL